MTEGDMKAQKATVNAWNNITRNSIDQITKRNKETQFHISCMDNRLKFPIGFAVQHRDSGNNFIGGYYIEGVKFSMHNVSKQASQLVLAESLSFSFDRVIPIIKG